MPTRAGRNFEVYVDGDLDTTLQPLVISESAGAERLDSCKLEVVEGTVEDFDITAWVNKEIEIKDPVTGFIRHWGKTTLVPIMLSTSGGEVLELVSRTELYHLGGKVDGIMVWDPIEEEATDIHADLIFNPAIDGKVYGNLNASKTYDSGGGVLNFLFLSPESVRTTAAQTLQDSLSGTWHLDNAVHYLLRTLNADAPYIINPTFVELSGILSDDALIQNVHIPRGMYLAQALDLLLNPLGYCWKVEFTALGVRSYKFWKRNTGGSLVSVFHQRRGATLSNPRVLNETNVDTASITFDVSRLANEVVIRGGFTEFEVTVELARGWDNGIDPSAGTGDEYRKDAEDFEGVKDVMRRWVLNEAGDYIGLRPEIDGLWTSAFRTALATAGIVSNQFIARRRRFLPTLTLDDDQTPIGKTHGIEVEYSNTSDPEWKPAEFHGIEVFEHECGIYFGGEHIPEEFLTDPANTRVRVTATIRADRRLLGYSPKVITSPCADVVPLVLDLPDRFHFRVRGELSKYNGSGLPSLAADDLLAIVAFAEFIRATSDVMDVGGPIQIEGLDNGYNVGNRIQNISIKNVSFTYGEGGSTYPTIVAIERNVPDQITTLHLQRHSDPIPAQALPRGFPTRYIRGRYEGTPS